jgi:hypothetical protein
MVIEPMTREHANSWALGYLIDTWEPVVIAYAELVSMVPAVRNIRL